MPSDATDHPEEERVWKERPDVIKRFLRERPRYEDLCGEVAYILEKRLREGGVEFSAVTRRAKTLESFAEKTSRKKYEDPFSEMTDMAGVRVVYLYTSDFARIEEVIRSEFEVVEKVDKVSEQGADKFGYGAVHFLVRLGRKSSGARYDDLKSLTCEVQVRTVLQDAWAIIDHHLAYKQESAIPQVLRRRMNSLVGLFETADDQFDRIRVERAKYVRHIESKLGRAADFLSQEINLDTVRAFLAWRIPGQEIERYDGHLSLALEGLDAKRYAKLADLDGALSRTQEARGLVLEAAGRPSLAAAARELGFALALDDPSYRSYHHERQHFFPDEVALMEKHEHLAKR